MDDKDYECLWKRPKNPKSSHEVPLSKDLRTWWRERFRFFYRTTLRFLSQLQNDYQNRVIPKEARISSFTKNMAHRTPEEVQDLWEWDDESVVAADQDETQELDITSIQDGEIR